MYKIKLYLDIHQRNNIKRQTVSFASTGNGRSFNDVSQFTPGTVIDIKNKDF